MTQKMLKVVPFRSAEWKKLAQALDQDSVHAHLSDDRSGFGMVRGVQSRVVPVLNPHEEERIIEIIEAQGFMVDGRVPKPFIRISLKKIKKVKQDLGALKRAIENRGALKSFVLGELVYAHEDFDEPVVTLIPRYGYEPHEERSYKQK